MQMGPEELFVLPVLPWSLCLAGKRHSTSHRGLPTEAVAGVHNPPQGALEY